MSDRGHEQQVGAAARAPMALTPCGVTHCSRPIGGSSCGDATGDAPQGRGAETGLRSRPPASDRSLLVEQAGDLGVVLWPRAPPGQRRRAILPKNSSMNCAASTAAQPGAAGVSFELAADAIGALANSSSPRELK